MTEVQTKRETREVTTEGLLRDYAELVGNYVAPSKEAVDILLTHTPVVGKCVQEVNRHAERSDYPVPAIERGDMDDPKKPFFVAMIEYADGPTLRAHGRQMEQGGASFWRYNLSIPLKPNKLGQLHYNDDRRPSAYVRWEDEFSQTAKKFDVDPSEGEDPQAITNALCFLLNDLAETSR